MSSEAPARTPLFQRAVESARFGHFAKWVVLSAVVGMVAGVVAWLFRGLILLCRKWLFVRPTGIESEGLGGPIEAHWWIVLIPALGGLIVGVLIHSMSHESEGHGTDAVVRAFHRMKGVMRSRVIALKALTSAITIGSGGSAASG